MSDSRITRAELPEWQAQLLDQILEQVRAGTAPKIEWATALDDRTGELRRFARLARIFWNDEGLAKSGFHEWWTHPAVGGTSVSLIEIDEDLMPEDLR